MEPAVKLISVYGTQEDIVFASRVCTSNEDKSLDNTPARINDLLRRKHWKPFEFVELTIMIEAPIYVQRQWRTHSGSFIEKSRRYTKDKPEFGGSMSDGDADLLILRYEKDLFDGVAPEDARKALPLDTMSKVLWKVNLRDLLSFFRQRLEEHAQKEIRELATDLLCQVYRIYPDVIESFLTYDMSEVRMGIDTMFDLFFLQKHGALAYTGSEKRIRRWGENAEKRLKFVKELFDRIEKTIPERGSDSGTSASSPADSPKVSPAVWNTGEAGTEGGDTAVEHLRSLVKRERETATAERGGDSGAKQLQLPFGEELPVQAEGTDEESSGDEAMGDFVESNIVEGRFGSIHT